MLKGLVKLANNIANNINRTTIRANVTGRVYKEDIDEVKSLASQIIRPLLFLQTEVAVLRRESKTPPPYVESGVL